MRKKASLLSLAMFNFGLFYFLSRYFGLGGSAIALTVALLDLRQLQKPVEASGAEPPRASR